MSASSRRDDTIGHIELRRLAERSPDGPPQIDVNYAYAQAFVFGQALMIACERGDDPGGLATVEGGVTSPLIDDYELP